MDILRLLDHLAELVDKPKSFAGLTWGFNKDEISMQIAKVKASVPTEMKQAAQTVRESERIVDTAREDATMTLEGARKEAERVLTEAKAEAERIVEQAKLQQERMVHESEILKLAKAQSEEIRGSADRDAVQMRRGAEGYAHEVLVQLESVVGRALQTIERGKTEIERADQNSAAQRERTRAS